MASGGGYVGEWKDDKQHGQGTASIFLAGELYEKYVGEWKDGKMHGQRLLLIGLVLLLKENGKGRKSEFSHSNFRRALYARRY